MMRSLWRCVLLIAVLSAFAVPGRDSLVAAQDGSSAQPPAGTTIHVVQRDETLFGIAMRYGTTVEAIASANGISDPRYITVGQRLLIPNARPDVTGAPVVHIVAPGDTLETLAARYHTSPEQIATANYITNPSRLFVGQELTIRQGASGDIAAQVPSLYRVQPGDNLLRLALRIGVSWLSLATANHLSVAGPLFSEQSLWIPGAADPPRDLPTPLLSLAINPTPPVQGQTMAVHLITSNPVTATGSFVGYPLQFASEEVDHYVALFGIHAFTAPGVHPLTLTLTRPDGQQTQLTLQVYVEDGNYSTEQISLDTQQQDLLTPQVTEPEWERVAQIMSTFTARRYFDGLMGLPSTGAITSQFGTRRAYNGGVLSTFHSGTDFGGAPGSPVTAPAAGVVVLAESLPVRGNATIIDHGWGVFTGYWHQAEIHVRVGDVVVPGQVIGTVGSTGRSTGPHLHWEMWVGGVQVDPMQWVQQAFP